MKTYRCTACDAEVYLAIAAVDPDSMNILQVDVAPCADGDVALAERYLGPNEGTMFEDDHIILWRRIPNSEVYNGPRRRRHQCPNRRRR